MFVDSSSPAISCCCCLKKKNALFFCRIIVRYCEMAYSPKGRHTTIRFYIFFALLFCHIILRYFKKKGKFAPPETWAYQLYVSWKYFVHCSSVIYSLIVRYFEKGMFAANVGIIIIIYIYHALINAQGAPMIHINQKCNILYTRRTQSYQNNLHKVLYDVGIVSLFRIKQLF